jgi:hypothetical protein
VIKVNDKKSLPLPKDFLCEPMAAAENQNGETLAASPEPAATRASLRSLTDVPNKMGLLLFNLGEAKNILRHQIEDNLQDNFSFPELIDHVVDYLLEVVQEDPRQRELLGLS